MRQLSDELRRAVQEEGDRPVEIIDSSTNRTYFLISGEQYERIKPLFEQDPLSQLEPREIIRRAGLRAGWDAPEMDAYDRYR